MAEFCAATVPVIMFDADGSQMVMTVGEVSFATDVIYAKISVFLAMQEDSSR